MGLPPSLNAIVGEASPEHARGTAERDESSPVPSLSPHSVAADGNDVGDELPESLHVRSPEVSPGSTVSTSPSADDESDGGDAMAMFIVGECAVADTDGECTKILTLIPLSNVNCGRRNLFP